MGEDPEPVQTVPSPPEVEEGYVHASNLRLRPEARSDTRTWTTLAINTRVRIASRNGDWFEVATLDGRTGFVHGGFVGPAPLTLEGVKDKIGVATSVEDRLTWWQRAAALRPTDAEVLGGLADAYRKLGRDKDAASVEKVRAAGGGGVAGWFPNHHERFGPVGAALAGAKDADALIKAWAEAQALVRELDEPLQAHYVDMSWAGEDPEPMLETTLPFGFLTYYAEGTAPAVELRSSVFVKHALRTPETWDDAFFKLVTTAYDNAGGGGWAAWEVRNWDYGGCSPFGGGDNLHLKLLQLSDAVLDSGRSAKVPELAANIRTRLLADIRQPSEQFPYCSVNTNERTPTEGLLTEAKAILDGVKLDSEERALVEGRISSRFGR